MPLLRKQIRTQATRSLIRLLRTIRPKRIRALPRQRQPDLIRLEYFRAIKKFTHAAIESSARTRTEILKLYAADAPKKDHFDAEENKEKIKNMVNLAGKRAADEYPEGEVAEVAERFGRRTSEFNREQLGRQIDAGLGIPLSALERPIVEKVSGFVEENVDLIKTVNERYFDRIQARVEQAYEEGWTAAELAEEFEGLDGISDNDAMRIARDQIGKLNGEINQERQEALGIDSYIWRAVMDNRTRDEHADRDGDTFSWSDPPEDGHPGEPINCRCFAEPVLDGILGEET